MSINGDAWLMAMGAERKLGYSNPLNAMTMHVEEDDKLTERIVQSAVKQRLNQRGMSSIHTPTTNQYGAKVMAKERG